MSWRELGGSWEGAESLSNAASECPWTPFQALIGLLEEDGKSLGGVSRSACSVSHWLCGPERVPPLPSLGLSFLVCKTN